MSESCARPVSPTTDSPLADRSIGRRIYLDAAIDAQLENQFYTGFSGNIRDGGIFVSTFDIQPLNTPVTVRIQLAGEQTITVDGLVQWHREYRAGTCETTPGMGIRFIDLDRSTAALIEAVLEQYPAYFYDDSDEPVVRDSQIAEGEPAVGRESPPLTESVSLPTAHCFEMPEPAPFDPLADLLSERRFFEGMARDVAALTQRPVLFSTKPAAPIDRPTEGIDWSGAEPILAQVVPNISANPQFPGGFSADDTGRRLFVATDVPRRVGTRLLILLHTAGSRPLSLRGEVTWVRRPNRLVQSLARPGMGIRIEGLTAAEARLFADCLPLGHAFVMGEEL